MRYITTILSIIFCLNIFSISISHGKMTRKEQAGNHFQRGMAFYEAGKYLQAIKEMKSAYKLIPKPIILRYIGDIYKEAGLKEEAITYYRKFMDEARLKDPTRKIVAKKLKALGASIKAPDPIGVGPTKVVPVDPVKVVVKKPKKRKRKYKKGELIHSPLEEAQPGHPAKIDVELPEIIKKAWLSLFYRKQGEENYKKVKMKVDKNDVYYFILPCDAVTGSILQYYIEAKGTSGRKIAGSGTASAPFIVDIGKSNPLQPGGKMSCAEAIGETPGDGSKSYVPNTTGTPKTPGRPKSFYLAIGTSVVSAAMLLTSIVMGNMAMIESQNLEDSQMTDGRGYIPFTGDVADYEANGKSYEQTMFITAGITVITAVAATYFWMDYLGKIPTQFSLDAKLTGRKSKPKVVITPIVGDGLLGIGGSFNF
jgi:hypothetical protein